LIDVIEISNGENRRFYGDRFHAGNERVVM